MCDSKGIVHRDRADLNAHKRELAEAFFQLNLDGRTRAILVTGANGDFCAGDDMGGSAELAEGERRLGAPMPRPEDWVAE